MEARAGRRLDGAYAADWRLLAASSVVRPCCAGVERAHRLRRAHARAQQQGRGSAEMDDGRIGAIAAAQAKAGHPHGRHGRDVDGDATPVRRRAAPAASRSRGEDEFRDTSTDAARRGSAFSRPGRLSRRSMIARVKIGGQQIGAGRELAGAGVGDADGEVAGREARHPLRQWSDTEGDERPALWCSRTRRPHRRTEIVAMPARAAMPRDRHGRPARDQLRGGRRAVGKRRLRLGRRRLRSVASNDDRARSR